MGPPETIDNGTCAPRDERPPGLDQRDVARLVAIAVFAIATLLAVAADWDSPVRTALTIAFLLFGPGLALAELLEIEDPVQRLALATAASLAVETLVAVVLLYAERFSALGVCGIVVGMTGAALVGAVWRRGLATTAMTRDETRGAAT